MRYWLACWWCELLTAMYMWGAYGIHRYRQLINNAKTVALHSIRELGTFKTMRSMPEIKCIQIVKTSTPDTTGGEDPVPTARLQGHVYLWLPSHCPWLCHPVGGEEGIEHGTHKSPPHTVHVPWHQHTYLPVLPLPYTRTHTHTHTHTHNTHTHTHALATTSTKAPLLSINNHQPGRMQSSNNTP